MPSLARPVPRWLLWGFTAFVLIWAPSYAWYYGPANFLWLCDLAVVLTLIGLWRNSATLVSAAACGVLLVQVGFAIDLVGGLAGRHPIGGTEYMFDGAIPLGIRLLSLFHLALPVVHVIALQHLRYEPRGWWWMTGLMWAALAASYVFFADDNLNMVLRPFGREQTLVPGSAYFAGLFMLYPIAIFGPAHVLLARWLGPRATTS